MSWAVDNTETTRAFDEWRQVDRDQRAFLKLGLAFTRDAYQELWDRIGQEPGDGESEWEEVFDQRVEGLWPHDYEWMQLAAVVRDAVTSFEVYLSKACTEVLRAHGVELADEPGWRDLKEILNVLGVKVETGPIRRIRKIRHVLTHQRGELRTEEQRRQYALDPKEVIPHYVIEFSEDRVRDMLTELGEEVRRLDAVACRYTWRHERSEELAAFIEAHREPSDTH